MKILKDNEFIEKRPSKLDIDDYLKLLYIFNENEVHFKWLILIDRVFC